jgi:hypothetical protein
MSWLDAMIFDCFNSGKLDRDQLRESPDTVDVEVAAKTFLHFFENEKFGIFLSLIKSFGLRLALAHLSGLVHILLLFVVPPQVLVENVR